MHEAFWKQLQRIFEVDWDSRKYKRCRLYFRDVVFGKNGLVEAENKLDLKEKMKNA